MSAIDINLTDSSEYNLTFYQGRTLEKTIVCDVYSGNTLVGFFDFTPYSGATMDVKIKTTDTYTVMKFSTEDGSIILNPDGELVLAKSASAMNIKAGKYFYDLYLRKDGNVKRAFLNGAFNLIQKVSE